MGNKQNAADKLLDVSMDLKLTSRQLEKDAQKVESKAKAEEKKIRQAMDKNQVENARVYAENVIRGRKEALNLRRFGAKMAALSAKLESAYRTQNVSQQIKSSVPLLSSCMKQMDKMGVHGSIEKFERLFEDMDVKTEELNGALDSVYNSAVD